MNKITLEERVTNIERQLVANAVLIEEIHADMKLTQDIHGWIEKGRGFFMVCGWIASGLKWVAGLVVVVAASWAILFSGRGGGGQP